MDPASWANDHHATIADDSEYDNDPELSGYQTLPEVDTKDDSEQETSLSTSPVNPKATFTGISQRLSESSATVKGSVSGHNDSTGQSEIAGSSKATGQQPASSGAGEGAASGVIEGMKPNALAILQGTVSMLLFFFDRAEFMIYILTTLISFRSYRYRPLGDSQRTGLRIRYG